MDHSRRANRDPLALPFGVLGFPAPDLGCRKTGGSSTLRLPTIVQQDTAWRVAGETTEKVDFPCGLPESRTIHASFSQNCWPEARALPGGRINCSRNYADQLEAMRSYPAGEASGSLGA